MFRKEKGLDRDSFTESFDAHTKSNLEANGQRWSRKLEDSVAALAPNRWSDVQAGGPTSRPCSNSPTRFSNHDWQRS